MNNLQDFILQNYTAQKAINNGLLIDLEKTENQINTTREKITKKDIMELLTVDDIENMNINSLFNQFNNDTVIAYIYDITVEVIKEKLN